MGRLGRRLDGAGRAGKERKVKRWMDERGMAHLRLDVRAQGIDRGCMDEGWMETNNGWMDEDEQCMNGWMDGVKNGWMNEGCMRDGGWIGGS